MKEIIGFLPQRSVWWEMAFPDGERRDKVRRLIITASQIPSVVKVVKYVDLTSEYAWLHGSNEIMIVTAGDDTPFKERELMHNMLGLICGDERPFDVFGCPIVTVSETHFRGYGNEVDRGWKLNKPITLWRRISNDSSSKR